MTVRQLENKIQRIEGFDVRIRHRDGRAVRGDARIIDRFRFERARYGHDNVREWIDSRFRPFYREYTIDVLRADGRRAHGNQRLAALRDSYFD